MALIKHHQLIEFLTQLNIRFKHEGAELGFHSYSPISDVNDGCITWLGNDVTTDQLLACSVYIVPYKNQSSGLNKKKCVSLIQVDSPRVVFALILNYFFVSEFKLIESHKNLSNKYRIGLGTVIYPDVKIGEGTVIHNNVVIYPGTIIGKNVQIESNCVIGSKGFGYVKYNEKLIHFPHLGGVVISDDVEIGSNTCIDRGTMSNTFIGEGTKVSNLCQIAHNTNIGKNCLIAGKAQIGGGSIIGDDTYVGPSVVVSNKLNIGRNCDIKIGSVVISDVEDGKSVSGNFAIEHKKNLRLEAKKRYR